MENYDIKGYAPQSCPFDSNDLGIFKGFYSSDEFTFTKMHGTKSLLWILVPLVGWIILIAYFIGYIIRTNPTRNFWVFEKGFVWKKGSSVQKILYADIDELYYKSTKYYKNGSYGDTAHTFNLSKNGKTFFKNTARERNEMDMEEKKTYLVRAFEAAAAEIQKTLIARALEEYSRRNYVTIKDDEVLIGDGFIRDKTGYDYTPDNISKAYYDDGEIIILGKDYKKKVIGYEGHKLTLSMETNRAMKLYLLEELFGLDL